MDKGRYAKYSCNAEDSDFNQPFLLYSFIERVSINPNAAQHV